MSFLYMKYVKLKFYIKYDIIYLQPKGNVYFIERLQNTMSKAQVILSASFPVRYNGGTEGGFSSDNPEKLEKGKIYWVTKVIQNKWHTEYIIEGIAPVIGFNSVWFDDVDLNSMPIYDAIISRGWYPEVGEKLYNFSRRLHGETSTSCWQSVKHSGTIQFVRMIATDMFYVVTGKS